MLDEPATSVSIGLVCDPRIAWLLVNEPDVNRAVMLFIGNEVGTYDLPVAGPPTILEIMKTRHAGMSALPELPVVTLKLSKAKYDYKLVVRIACSDTDLLMLEAWRLTKESKRKLFTAAGHQTMRLN
jgi:hypothetical protein